MNNYIPSREYSSHRFSHKSTVYIIIMIMWILLELFGAYPLLKQAIRVFRLNYWLVGFLLLLNLIFISYFWLNGIKDLVYVPFFYHYQPKRIKREHYIEHFQGFKKSNPRVVMCYTTCDDFMPQSLEKSMHQTYPHCYTVILDDSKSVKYQHKVNTFAREHNIKVIRRTHHIGYKAGNLNHYLMHHSDWDYFVPLDSDEIIPNDFVARALPFFAWDHHLGILQCNHISTRNYNKFMSLYARGASAHWPVYQSVKERYGFLSMLGHGAMISRKCLDDIGGFPLMVAEDISATLEATLRGWHIRFARTITCQEQFPLDYLGFRKRLDKWCSGNMQFTRRYSHTIFTSHVLTWYQKLDILLFVYGLPLNYIFSIFLLLNIMIFPLCPYSPKYPLWLLVPTIILFFAPMCNDMIFNIHHAMTFIDQIQYSWDSTLLYGGMYYPTIYTSIRLLLGAKARFVVTPKSDHYYTLLDAIYANWRVLLFAILLSIISFFMDNGLSPVILVIIPALCSVHLTLMSNHRGDSHD